MISFTLFEYGYSCVLYPAGRVCSWILSVPLISSLCTATLGIVYSPLLRSFTPTIQVTQTFKHVWFCSGRIVKRKVEPIRLFPSSVGETKARTWSSALRHHHLSFRKYHVYIYPLPSLISTQALDLFSLPNQTQPLQYNSTSPHSR